MLKSLVELTSLVGIVWFTTYVALIFVISWYILLDGTKKKEESEE